MQRMGCLCFVVFPWCVYVTESVCVCVTERELDREFDVFIPGVCVCVCETESLCV